MAIRNLRYENDERIPPLDTIIKFAKYYNVSIDYIAKLTDIKEPYPKNYTLKNK